MDYDNLSPEVLKALEMAQQLVEFCNKHKFPQETRLAGCAIYGDAMIHDAYHKGVKAEKKRISIVLGLTV